MTRFVDSELLARIQENDAALVRCWKITRIDGQVFRFVEHDTNIVFQDDTYLAVSAVQSTTVQHKADASVGNAEIEALIDQAVITDADLRAGAWDAAAVEIFLVDWERTDLPRVNIGRGWFGEAEPDDTGRWRVEYRSLTQRLQQRIGEVLQPQCRRDLGDRRCKVPVDPTSLWTPSQSYKAGTFIRRPIAGPGTSPYDYGGVIFEVTTAGTSGTTEPTWNGSVNGTTADNGVVWTTRAAWARPGTVQSSADRRTLVAEADGIEAYADDWFPLGVLKFMTGANAGLAREVVSWSQASRTLVLFDPLPFLMQPGDEFFVHPGCNGSYDSHCIGRFNNRYNFRGEPFLPGQNAILDYGNATATS